MEILFSGYGIKDETIGLYHVDNDLNYKRLAYDSIASPAFMVSDGQFIFTSEKKNGITLYCYLIQNNKLVVYDTKEIPGSSITHLAYSKKNNLLIGCSYADGSFFSMGVDNGKFTTLYTYQKQIEDDRLSRCHCVFLNKEEDILGVVNIALDAIYFYDIKNGGLIEKNIINFPKGCGPRHSIYNHDDSLIYTMTEYSNEVIIADSKTGQIVQTISTIPNFDGATFGATLCFSKDNKYLYTSNRGEDTIAKFEVNPNGTLVYLNSYSCGGNHPRHMILTSDGKYIISCNKNSNNITFFDTLLEKIVLVIPFSSPTGVLEI